MPQRFEGRNIEDALNSAATALGVERYQLTHKVILEKRGFLGGVKRVVIEAEINPAAVKPLEPAPEPVHAAGRPVGERADRGGRRGRGQRLERVHEKRELATGRGGGRWREEEPPVGFDGPADLPPQGEESEIARTVRDWLQKVLSLAKLDVELRTEENEKQLLVRICGCDTHRLTENHAELLDALQVLANKALIGRKVDKDIELDCDRFKDRRVEQLGQRAREIADRVRRDRQEQLLPAMTPIERRIVHLTLQHDEEVTTESRGEGFYKRVAIIPRPAAALTIAADAEPQSGTES